MIDETNDACPLLKVFPVGQRRCSRSGNPYGQPRWGFLGSGESASVRFRKSKKGRDFPSPPTSGSWWNLGRWKFFQLSTNSHSFIFRHLQCGVLTMPGRPSQTWKIILKKGRNPAPLRQEHAVPSLAASYVRRLQSVRQNLRQKSQGRSMGNFVVFGWGEGCSFWQVRNLVVLFLMKLFNLPNLKTSFKFDIMKMYQFCTLRKKYRSSCFKTDLWIDSDTRVDTSINVCMWIDFHNI